MPTSMFLMLLIFVGRCLSSGGRGICPAEKTLITCAYYTDSHACADRCGLPRSDPSSESVQLEDHRCVQAARAQDVFETYGQCRLDDHSPTTCSVMTSGGNVTVTAECFSGTVRDPCVGFNASDIQGAALLLTLKEDSPTAQCTCTVVSSSPQDFSLRVQNLFSPSAVHIAPTVTVTKQKGKAPLTQRMDMEYKPVLVDELMNSVLRMQIFFNSNSVRSQLRQSLILSASRGFALCCFNRSDTKIPICPFSGDGEKGTGDAGKDDVTASQRKASRNSIIGATVGCVAVVVILLGALIAVIIYSRVHGSANERTLRRIYRRSGHAKMKSNSTLSSATLHSLYITGPLPSSSKECNACRRLQQSYNCRTNDPRHLRCSACTTHQNPEASSGTDPRNAEPSNSDAVHADPSLTMDAVIGFGSSEPKHAHSNILQVIRLSSE